MKHAYFAIPSYRGGRIAGRGEYRAGDHFAHVSKMVWCKRPSPCRVVYFLIAFIATLHSHIKATTQSEMVKNAVRKPGQAHMTMKIIRMAQMINPIIVVCL